MNHDSSSLFSLSIFQQWLLSLVAFFLVAFGQPAWLPLNGLLASAFGFALFWRVLLAHPLKKHRFFLGTLWFGAVQLVQLSWFVSHPYWYIYAVYFFLILSIGIQFGLTSLFIRKELFLRRNFFYALIGMLPIAAFWTLCEWMRLFLLSGLSWNPVGMSLTSNLYALQAASLMGLYGLSFWVILVNLLALWAWTQKNLTSKAAWIASFSIPYVFGFFHLAVQEGNFEKEPRHLDALLVQTAFAPEELQGHFQKSDLTSHVIDEWRRILEIVKKHQRKPIHLIVLPEFVVPYGTYSNVYPLIEVKKTFSEVFGPDSLRMLPPLDHPFALFQNTPHGLQIFVNNAYWAQGLANYFQADLLIGLEDAEDISPIKREYYSAALLFRPEKPDSTADFTVERYSKRVLVPLGEYIPFEACKKLAERYGVFGSFTCGKEAVVMKTNGIFISPSICYEETFGNLMKEGRQKGTDLFVNLTSDVWYPNSKLPQQHFDHARLRTVENGVPLIRACNTGITAAIDCLGRNIAVLGGDHPEEMEWIPDSLLVHVPIHTYRTLYSQFGDFLIIGFSLFFILISFVDKK